MTKKPLMSSVKLHHIAEQTDSAASPEHCNVSSNALVSITAFASFPTPDLKISN